MIFSKLEHPNNIILKLLMIKETRQITEYEGCIAVLDYMLVFNRNEFVPFFTRGRPLRFE